MDDCYRPSVLNFDLGKKKNPPQLERARVMAKTQFGIQKKLQFLVPALVFLFSNYTCVKPQRHKSVQLHVHRVTITTSDNRN
jgi:hypothetical protein